MSWPTLDDAAPTHRKQLAAGALACWLWTCGLCYCERQETKNGLIPHAVVKLLYPGLGLKQAKRLVEVGLWLEVDAGYLVHEYESWREKRFGGQQSERGSKGGSVASEAKRLAALKREADKREARTNTTSRDHNGHHNRPQAPTTTVVTKTTSHSDPIRSDPIPDLRSLPPSGDLTGSAHEEPSGVVVVVDLAEENTESDPGVGTICPTDLVSRLELAGTVRSLAEHLAVPVESVRHELRSFVGYWVVGKGSGQRRTGWAGKARQWVVDQHAKPGGLKPPGAVAHDRHSGADAVPENVRAFTASVLGNLAQRDR